MTKLILSAAALLVLLSGCATIVDVPYTPNPARATDPMADAKALIAANVVQGCVVEFHDGAQMLMIQYVCDNGGGAGAGNSVVRFDQIQSITLQQSGEWYRALVKHKTADEFFWSSKSKEDMEKLIDAFTALSQPAGAPAATPAGTTTPTDA